ncbi:MULTISPECIES: hypothetical protein [Bacillales]|nr:MULTISPECIES: hypothetical protein [Bacillales]
MKMISSMFCRMLGYHKYSYFTDRCVRCGKVRSSNSSSAENT